MFRLEEQAKLAEAADNWRFLGWFQLALIPVLAWLSVDGWPFQFWVPAFIFFFVRGVRRGSRLSVTALFLFAVLALLWMFGQTSTEIREGHSPTSYHIHHISEFANVFVLESGWASLITVWWPRRIRSRLVTAWRRAFKLSA
jgi:hypothetical protein